MVIGWMGEREAEGGGGTVAMDLGKGKVHASQGSREGESTAFPNFWNTKS